MPRKLIIRTNKLLERLYGKPKLEQIDSVLSFEGYTISKNQRTVFKVDEEIQLTNKEFEFLVYFIQNKNILISREQILTSVWGDDYFGSDRVVDDTIRRLRKKMDRLNIETIYGFGYKLVHKA